MPTTSDFDLARPSLHLAASTLCSLPTTLIALAMSFKRDVVSLIVVMCPTIVENHVHSTKNMYSEQIKGILYSV